MKGKTITNKDKVAEYFRDFNVSIDEIKLLTDICFQKKDYIQNFPQVFDIQNKEYLFCIKHQNKLASFCSLYPYSFSFNNTRLSAYCIGSVCTHPKMRNLGLAQFALNLAEEKAKENSADFVFLFADNQKLYSYLNYKYAGQMFLAPIGSYHSGKKNLNSLIDTIKNIENKYCISDYSFMYFKNISEINFQEKSSIWRFIVKNAPRSETILSFLEFLSIVKIKNMSVYILCKENKIVSLCFLDKGDDFQNVIHSPYFIKTEFIVILLYNILATLQNNNLIFFPGSNQNEFKDIFDFLKTPSLSIKSLDEKKFPTNELINLCTKNSLFVSSLQGT
ncbi:GNAT family N-acetyltransferase [Spirobacillus cienkowskii]|uniref:GNAT family N-acetyltransferase n=1 Tax=Spirobacillus cienkowskii TaxID=495820 RepID=UPI0030D41F0F